MAEFLIEYNPYQETTKVSKNGILESPNSKMRSFMNRERLQNWFNKEENWPGLGETIERENNDRTCEITFKGRSIDFEDLEDYFKNHYQSKTQINLKNIPAKNDEDIMAGIERLVDTVEKEAIFEEKKIKGLRDTYRRLKDGQFSMSIIAKMSSGKSTLFNAILRKDFLPTGDKATTAKIVEVRHDEGIKNFDAECFDNKDKLILKKKTVNAEDMKTFNDNENIHKIKVNGNIPGIKSDTMNLMLRDTPGPNNSQNRRHKEITESVIKDDKNMSVIIYLMKADDFATDSDKELLKSISKAMKDGGKQAKDRVLFVISKADIWIDTEGQTMDSLIEDTKEYLLEEFEIVNPNIFPVNALLAEQIWRSINGSINNKNTEKLLRRGIEDFSDEEETEAHFEKFATLSSSGRKTIESQLKEAIDSGDDKKIALVHTGVPALEVTINEYLNKYAYPIKISEAVREFKDIIDDEKMREEFMTLLEGSEKAVNDAKEQIENSKKKKDERERKRKEFEEKIDKCALDAKEAEKVREIAEKKLQNVINMRMKGLGVKIEVDKSKNIVSALIKDISSWESETQREVTYTLENKVYYEGEMLLKKYGEYMKDLEENIDIEGFDLNRVAEFKKYDFAKMEEISKKPTSYEGVYKEKEIIEIVPNPDKRWWSFWRPKTIEVPKVEKEKVGEVQYVKRADVMDEIAKLSIHIEDNINSIFENYKWELEQFKFKFKSELGKLDRVIEKTLEEIGKMIEVAENHERDKSYYIEKIEKLEKIISKLNEVTSI